MKLIHLVLVPLFASVMTGCAMSNKKIDLGMPTELATTKTSAAESQPIRIKLNTFGDARITKNVGAIGYSSAKILSDTNISQWVTSALRQGLIRSGFEVVDDNNPDFTIDGSIVTVYCVGAINYKAQVELLGTMNKGHSTFVIEGNGYSSSIKVYDSASSYKKNLEQALADAVNSMTAQIKQKTAQ